MESCLQTSVITLLLATVDELGLMTTDTTFNIKVNRMNVSDVLRGKGKQNADEY